MVRAGRPPSLLALVNYLRASDIFLRYTVKPETLSTRHTSGGGAAQVLALGGESPRTRPSAFLLLPG